jgi:hypothetical protein
MFKAVAYDISGETKYYAYGETKKAAIQHCRDVVIAALRNDPHSNQSVSSFGFVAEEVRDFEDAWQNMIGAACASEVSHEASSPLPSRQHHRPDHGQPGARAARGCWPDGLRNRPRLQGPRH